ncbi:hypothetical protein AB4Z52_19070 [Rhizobium sp. 2YAF20]|uniref:hypothetical protein n=1 Tax=Rhizobium sp. 2YAF20 TaxID=3233027 RepID=UPI003F95D38F
MKPPWKYLAQLMSRRQPPEVPDQTIARDGDRKLVEIELRPAPAIVLASPETAADPVHNDISRSNDIAETENGPKSDASKAAPVSLPPEEQKVGAINAPHQSGSDVPALTPTNSPQTRQTKPSWAQKKGPLNAVEQSTAVAADEKPVSQTPASSANPFFDEAASLDEDIKQLKDQLAQKLRLQNAQLRKMLERFERS